VLLGVVGAALAPLAEAHGGHGMGQDLVAAGESLMIGRAESALPGALVVVPRVPGALGCEGLAESTYVLPLGSEAGVAFVANGSAIEARLDVPPADRVFAAVALDTGGAVRALVGMQETVERLHRLRAIVLAPDGARAREGVLGEAPFAVSGGHGEGSGLDIAYDADSAPAVPCADDPPGHARLVFPRDEGTRVLHAVVLLDRDVPQFLPRPLDTTRVLQANLLLAEPGEDAASVRAALAGGAPSDTLPLAALGAVLALLLVRRPTSPAGFPTRRLP
jgi:hypothetical protein